MVTRGMENLLFVLFRPLEIQLRGRAATGTAIILIVAEGGKGIFVLKDTDVEAERQGTEGRRDRTEWLLRMASTNERAAGRE